MPGLLRIFAGGRPACSVIALDRGRLVLGREQMSARGLEDTRMSRTHAEVRFDGARFHIRDLGSRNGTFVDGQRLRGRSAVAGLRTVRAGSSLFLLCADLRPFRAIPVARVDGADDGADDGGDALGPSALIRGPGLAAVWQTIAGFARADSNLFLHGESGTGKEQAVRAFHAGGPRRQRPLVAVNCGAIPDGMAERLLFGTMRGAYSGAAADAPGYVQAAHEGILFLDEIAELSLAAQAKLLRVLESKEVLPLGETRPRRVDFRICAATHRDLHAEVGRGRFRQDLYFRVARPEVRLPPLRERREEIPWLIALAVEQAAAPAAGGARLGVHVSFVDACMQRHWPGNVRELLVETRAAAQLARTKGSRQVEEAHLPPRAGVAFEDPEAQHPSGSRALPDDDVIAAALAEHGSNVSAAARALGVHRTQLRRWLERNGHKAGEPAAGVPGRKTRGP